MKLKPFLLYTTLGGGIWIWILLQIGFMTGVKYKGDKIDSVEIEDALIILTIVIVIAYLAKLKLFRHHK